MDCAICYESLLTNESDTDVEIITQLSCEHIYHTECIDKWIVINNSCPICRKSVIVSDSVDITEDNTYITIVPPDDIVINVNIHITEEPRESQFVDNSTKVNYIKVFVEIIAMIFLISVNIVNIIYQQNLINSIQNYVDTTKTSTITNVMNNSLSYLEIGLFVFIILIKFCDYKYKIDNYIIIWFIKLALIISIFTINTKYTLNIWGCINTDSNILKYDNIKNVYDTYKIMWFMSFTSFSIVALIDVINFIRNHNIIFIKNFMMYCFVKCFKCIC
jgi:hypothetical protein